MQQLDIIQALCLALLKGLSLTQKKRLINCYGGVSALYRAFVDREPLLHDFTVRGISPEKYFEKATEEFYKTQQEGLWIKVYGEVGYPKLLSLIPNPPIVFFGRGHWPEDESRYLSFIGPRTPSFYGLRTAKCLAQGLAEGGLTLVSGLALGIDAIAHKASLENQMPTIAVLGCGLGYVYPKAHEDLYKKIENNGAIISEYLFQEQPRKENFPRRNRIISGLSKALLVIEGGEKSGVRITVGHALDQSREVFAVPGPIDGKLSYLPNRLISDGAKCVLNVADLLAEYGLQEVQKVSDVARQDLSADEKNLLASLDIDNGLSAEDLAQKNRWPVSRVLSCLTELELKGYIERQMDASYVRVLIQR